MKDPTLGEMRDLLASQYADLDDFEREAAIYWFANLYHGGQWSSLYSALSMSQYRPGKLECECPEEAHDLFDTLVSEYA